MLFPLSAGTIVSEMISTKYEYEHELIRQGPSSKSNPVEELHPGPPELISLDFHDNLR